MKEYKEETREYKNKYKKKHHIEHKEESQCHKQYSEENKEKLKFKKKINEIQKIFILKNINNIIIDGQFPYFDIEFHVFETQIIKTNIFIIIINLI